MQRYKSKYTGSQMDVAVERALSGGAIDLSLSDKQYFEFLDNTDFTNPVAQAGIGGMHGSVAYALDRWKLLSGTVSWNSNGLALNGTIRQIREYSIGFDVVPSVEMHSGAANITYDDTTKCCDITSSGGVIKRPHLGTTAITDWSKVPKPDKGLTMQKCREYYIKSAKSISLFAKDNWNFYAQSQSFSPTMRTVPSVIVYSSINGTANALSTNSETPFPDFTDFTISATTDGFNFQLNGTLTAGNFYAARGYDAIADV